MSLMCPARPLAQFLETIEVVIDVNLVKESSSAVATVKGGFRVDPPSDDDAGDGTQAVVTEYMYYSKRGGEETSDQPPNDWGCAFVSDELRVCVLYPTASCARTPRSTPRRRRRGSRGCERDAAAKAHLDAKKLEYVWGRISGSGGS